MPQLFRETTVNIYRVSVAGAAAGVMLAGLSKSLAGDHVNAE